VGVVFDKSLSEVEFRLLFVVALSGEVKGALFTSDSIVSELVCGDDSAPDKLLLHKVSRECPDGDMLTAH